MKKTLKKAFIAVAFIGLGLTMSSQEVQAWKTIYSLDPEILIMMKALKEDSQWKSRTLTMNQIRRLGFDTLKEKMLEEDRLFEKEEKIKACQQTAQTPYKTLKDVHNALIHCDDVNARDKYGRTPLHWTIRNGEKEIIFALIANGTDVNAKEENGNTALILAACQNYKEVVFALIANGADVNAKNKNGDMPLTLAVGRGYKEVVTTLIANGAEVNTKNGNGNTALTLAVQGSDTEIVKILREAAKTDREKLKQKILETIKGFSPS